MASSAPEELPSTPSASGSKTLADASSWPVCHTSYEVPRVHRGECRRLRGQQIDAIVIGRTTFDQVLGFGDWPYHGKDTYVLTSRSIESPPQQTIPWEDGAAKLIEHLRGMSLQRDVWLLGGPESIHAFREFGAVDATKSM